MKSYNAVLVALGLVSSSVLAQSGLSASEPAPGQSRMPMPAMGVETGVVPSPDERGVLSSGASNAEMTQSGRDGQLVTPAIAQSRPAAEATSVGVQPQTKNGVTYMCGGIGSDESTYMKQTAARDYNLMMTFAEQRGNYVADVAVRIKDARGKIVLETTCDGPILLVNLPSAGSYRIHAESSGNPMDRTVAVKNGKGHARQVTFAWPHHD